MPEKIYLQVMMSNKGKCFHIKASKDKTEVETKMKDRNNRTFGYLYDFWVFVVGQSADENMMQRSKLQYGGLTCRIWNYTSPDSFAFPVCDSSGVYYDVTSSAEEEAGTIFIREKAKIDEHYFCVPWKSEQEIRDVKPITIDSEYRNELIHLLHGLVNKSPVKKMYVQIRCQGLERDNIIGMITVEQFGDMIAQDKLLGNMVYVIHEP